MKKYFKITCLFSIILLLFAYCKPNTPLPTASIIAKVTNNVVIFTLETSNSSAYKWRFGDGDSAIVYSSVAVTHAYPKDGATYSVSVMVLGPGGETNASTTVNIPVMNQIDMLTGGTSYPKGKAWRISSSHGIELTKPDSNFTVLKNYPAGVFNTIGLSGAYLDQYIFFSNSNYTISPQSGGVLAGIIHCTVNSIPNVQPQAADSVGLTYATPYKPQTGLTFTMNKGKNLIIPTTADGISTSNVRYNNVNTLSFALNGFVGLMDFMSECIIQQIDPSHMTLAIFISDVQAQAPQVGKVTKVLIVTLEVAN